MCLAFLPVILSYSVIVSNLIYTWPSSSLHSQNRDDSSSCMGLLGGLSEIVCKADIINTVAIS
jgi:hypothetical protein